MKENFTGYLTLSSDNIAEGDTFTLNGFVFTCKRITDKRRIHPSWRGSRWFTFWKYKYKEYVIEVTKK